MDDINFDELDKAVNSALQTNDAASSLSAVQPEAQPVAEVTVPQPADVAPATLSPTASAPVNTPAPSVAPTKRRGQFMDMVHPSSDMRSAPQVSTTTPPARRQQQDIRPLDPNLVQASGYGSVQAEKPAMPEHVTNEAVASIVSAASGEPEQTERDSAPDYGDAVAPKHEWPDPLDVAPQPSTTEVAGVDTTSDEGIYTPDQNAAVAAAEGDFSSAAPAADEEVSLERQDQDDTQTPQNGPFIEGAEVEKRPLGAFIGTPKQDENPALDEVSVPIELPQELGPDVVSVESDDPEVGARSENDKELNTTEPATLVTSDTGVAQSIPQQYMPEKVATGEEDDHSVFDTQEYHQPLTPPAKQHKGLGVLKYFLIGALLLALGAVGGYAVYLLN